MQGSTHQSSSLLLFNLLFSAKSFNRRRVPSLKRKIDELVKEEEMKRTLFQKYKEELSLTGGDLDELEKIREELWRETKKRHKL